MSEPRIQARGAGFEIDGSPLLSDVTFSAETGELLALVGPNGAGKSTMLSLLAGDNIPTSGTVEIEGQDVTTWRPRDLARRQAVMTQQQSLAFSFTVEELVRMGRSPQPASDEDGRIVAEAMRDAEIDSFADRDVTTLSGGELARAVYARVLAQGTPILLLDEPTAPLDLRHQERVMATASALARAGACVLVVLHDLSLAARYCDRVAVFDHGSLVALGTPEDVFTPARISEVYEQPVTVLAHPVTGRPLIVPV